MKILRIKESTIRNIHRAFKKRKRPSITHIHHIELVFSGDH